MAAKTKPAYEPQTQYLFRVLRTIRVDGVRLSRSEGHEAAGEFVNRVVAQEGDDVIDTAYAI